MIFIGQTIDRSIVSEFPVGAAPVIERPKNLITDKFHKSFLDRKSDIVNVLCNLKWEGLLLRKELKESSRVWKQVWGIITGEM
jgi:hypothetical protein